MNAKDNCPYLAHALNVVALKNDCFCDTSCRATRYEVGAAPACRRVVDRVPFRPPTSLQDRLHGYRSSPMSHLRRHPLDVELVFPHLKEEGRRDGPVERPVRSWTGMPATSMRRCLSERRTSKTQAGG